VINKLIEKWKNEWWIKKASELTKEYESKQSELTMKLEQEMKRNVEQVELQRDILYAKTKAEIEKGNILEAEVAYRIKNLEERKLELIKADNELKNQIKVIEAKAHPSTVWAEAFSSGFSKSWDMMMPLMMDGVNRSKKTLIDQAIQETIIGNNKKTH